ncbi:MAG: hypothetical protein Fur0041_23160 [Bacteroidia bacterium]
MKHKLDHIVIGLLAGILLPLFGLFLYYMFTYRSQTSFTGFLEYFTRIKILVASISLATYLTNLPLFFLLLWREMYNAGRGVLMATILYTLWVVYEKFIA